MKWEIGTISLDEETACLRNLVCLSCLCWSQLSIKKTSLERTKIGFWYRFYSVEFRSFRSEELVTSVLVVT